METMVVLAPAQKLKGISIFVPVVMLSHINAVPPMLHIPSEQMWRKVTVGLFALNVRKQGAYI